MARQNQNTGLRGLSLMWSVLTGRRPKSGSRVLFDLQFPSSLSFSGKQRSRTN
jgi:hypothetical protein